MRRTKLLSGWTIFVATGLAMCAWLSLVVAIVPVTASVLVRSLCAAPAALIGIIGLRMANERQRSEGAK